MLIFAVAVILLVGLQLFLKRTVLGRAIRATAEDPDTAELVGVNSRAVYAVAAAIAALDALRSELETMGAAVKEGSWGYRLLVVDDLDGNQLFFNYPS